MAATVTQIPTQFRVPEAQDQPAPQEQQQQAQSPAEDPNMQAQLEAEFFADDPNTQPASQEQQTQPPAEGPGAQAQPVAQATPVPQAPQTSQADLTALAAQQQVQMLQEQLAALQQQVQQAQQQAQQPAQEKPLLNLPENLDLTPEERQALGDHLPVLQKLSAATLAEATQPLVQRIQELQEQLAAKTQDIESRVDYTAQTSFRAALYAAVPDLDNLVNDPKFQHFLAQPVPYTGQTTRDLLSQAYDAQDTGVIARIMSDFRAQQQAQPAAAQNAGTSQGVYPAAAALQQPATQAASAVPATALAGGGAPGSKPMLSASKLRDATTLYQKGMMDHAKYQAIMKMYREAEREGRVVNDIGES